MAAGDPIVAIGTAKTLESSGASIAAGAVAQADDANYVLSTDAANWPDAEFVLTATFATAPTEGRAVNLFARPLDIDGTNDAPVPEAGRPTHYVGSFVVDNVTTTQTLNLHGIVARDLPRNAAYYLHNGTDQALSAGWKLIVIPRNVIPSPS